MDFEDIRIVGVDEKATMRAEAGGQMFNVVLKLIWVCAVGMVGIL